MNILAGVIGAVVGLLGVLLGAWVNSRREDRRWLRDNKLQGAADFITAAGQIYSYRRRPEGEPRPVGEAVLADWEVRMQNGRSVIHLLCSQETIDRADKLAGQVWHSSPTDKQHYEHTIDALRAFTRGIRPEIVGAVGKKGRP